MSTPLYSHIKNIAETGIKALGGLTDHHIKVVIYFVTKIIGFSNYRLDIDYSNKIIIVHVFTEGGQEMFAKVKNTIDPESLAGYKLMFAERKV